MALRRGLRPARGQPEPAARECVPDGLASFFCVMWSWSESTNRQPGKLRACVEMALKLPRGVQKWRKWMCCATGPGSWIHFPHTARSSCARRMNGRADSKRHLKVPGGVWRPHWESHAASYRKRNKSCCFRYFLSSSLICGSSAPSVFAPLAGSAHPPLSCWWFSSLHH